MKKIKFIQKLIKEEKIKLVETSKEISESYFQKSKNSLKASKLLFSVGLFEESISMAYYSMYYKVTALFYLSGIKCENHNATIILLKELFNLDNCLISNAKTERIDKQYYTDFKLTKQDCENLIQKTEEFNAYISDFIDNLTSKDITNFKKVFQEAYFNKRK